MEVNKMFNSTGYVKTLFDAEAFLRDTENQYRLVSQRPFTDSNGKVGRKGTVATLMIMHDHADHGVDKATGRRRDNNVFQTFDVTILTGETILPVEKGEIISLTGYRPDCSYVIDYSVILRFDGYEKAETKEGK